MNASQGYVPHVSKKAKMSPAQLEQYRNGGPWQCEYVDDPIVVPEGFWFLDSFESGNFLHSRFESLDVKSIKRVVDAHHLSREIHYWMSEEPFGMTYWDPHNTVHTEDGFYPTGGLYFVSARQVHKGELSQGVQIPRLSYKRKSHRGKSVGWGKVSELLDVTGFTFQEVIECYWQYVDPECKHTGFVEPKSLPILLGIADILPHGHIAAAYKQELLGILSKSPGHFNQSWIREDLIKTILRLATLGRVLTGSVNA